MPQLPFDIRHGEFVDVIGTPIRHNDITFVPAHVKLYGTSFSPVFPLIDWCKSNGISVPVIIHGDENAPWVLGRLMALFNTDNTPEDEHGEKSCLYASFLAVLHDDDNITIPFDCSDYYGRTSLYFSSENPPSDEHQARITDAYYKLLLDDANNLVDYKNRMFHSMSGEWVAFGVCHGEPYMDVE
ncbi:MAG: hypothetical protein GXP24_13345 [Planctomycetes bacterium]|nr:hypothetical protein [Planctomycetota bacterium]